MENTGDDSAATGGELRVRSLAPGERVALDLSSLEEWGDEPRASEPAAPEQVESPVEIEQDV